MEKKQRNSNLELFRIFMMLAIVAHHFVVNSGITANYDYQNITANMMFLQLFGFAGKSMINGFILITGYFMAKSKFSFNKLIKLYVQIKLYKVLVYIFLALIGQQDLGVKELVRSVFSVVYGMNVGFTGTFFLLYLLIPFINKLIGVMTKTNYKVLLGVLLFVFTIAPTFMMHETFCEIVWYIIMYMIGGYIRLYPNKFTESKKVTGISALVVFMLCYLSIIGITLANNVLGIEFKTYFFVQNANKILALLLGVCAFLCFKNINIKHNKFINTVATATFGILLIHSNSGSMRDFLWNDLLKVESFYENPILPLYAIACVAGIYIVCASIDLLRSKFIEKPLFKKLNSGDKYIKLCEKVDSMVN